jgi:hypothetical protein
MTLDPLIPFIPVLRQRDARVTKVIDLYGNNAGEASPRPPTSVGHYVCKHRYVGQSKRGGEGGVSLLVAITGYTKDGSVLTGLNWLRVGFAGGLL